MFATPAFAQTAGGVAAGGTSGTIFFFGQFVVIGLIFWFLILRPQQQRVKAHRAMIDAVKKGDGVVTGGGIVGKVTKVDADTVEVEIASGVKIKVVKGTLTDISPAGTGKPAND
jgi:preprotein translocase subunit YajC